MLISICIPAYKNLFFVERLMYSIAIQTFKDFEVVITDDSPDDELKNYISNYASNFSINYIKNDTALGTPENWNESIKSAKGKWIKLMHDDDWFANENSLAIFAKQTEINEAYFIFSAYENIYLDENKTELVFANPFSFRFWHLKKNIASLLSKNIIGPPSIVMHRNDGKIFYDKQMKWLVDIDFYYHVISSKRILYIPQALINVGLSKEQVTRSCFRIAAVEIPEYFYFMNKIGSDNLKNILVYDATWRLFRNLETKNEQDIADAGYFGKIELSILTIIQFQNKIPAKLLKIGVLSKILMLFHYIFFRKK